MEKPIITIRKKPSFFDLGTIFLILFSLFCLLFLITLSGSKHGGEAGMFVDAMNFLFKTGIGISAFILLIAYIRYYNKSAKYHNLKIEIEEYKKWLDSQPDLVQTNHKDIDTEP